MDGPLGCSVRGVAMGLQHRTFQSPDAEPAEPLAGISTTVSPDAVVGTGDSISSASALGLRSARHARVPQTDSKDGRRARGKGTSLLRRVGVASSSSRPTGAPVEASLLIDDSHIRGALASSACCCW